jgi:outer membrane biosynthesis protein TonB
VPSLDIAVLYAIRQAAPFPPTPHGKPLPLVLDYEPP